MYWYAITCSSVLFFALGFGVKSFFINRSYKNEIIRLVKLKEKGENNPILLQFDLNSRGGYSIGVCGINGIHTKPENHKKFLMALMFLIKDEINRAVSIASENITGISNNDQSTKKFKLLKFDKKD